MQLSEPADSESQLSGADSIYLRLSQLLERQRQELGRFRAGLDGSVAQGGMSLQEQDAAFVSLLIVASDIQRIDRTLRSLSAIRTYR